MQYSYLIEDQIVVRNKMDGSALERYDKNTNSWIPDWDLSEIFTGDVRFMSIKENEIWTYLNLQK